MEKRSGGTRNYSHRTKTLAKRRAEFDKVVSTHLYREEYFDKSGGYYSKIAKSTTHKLKTCGLAKAQVD